MEAMKVLDKKSVLKAGNLQKQLVEVPEWGGAVWVQEMTALARDRFDAWLMDNRENKNSAGIRVQVVVATVVDENGKPMFNDLDVGDLNSKSSKAINRIAEVGMRLSGLSEAVVEEEVKNYEAAQSGDSSSGSVVN